MYIPSFNTYINPLQPYDKNRPAAYSSRSQSSFRDELQKADAAYTLNKSFPVDYINKESTFYNKLRMQKDFTSDFEVAKSLDESLHVSSFGILQKRSESYLQSGSNITSSLKSSYPLTPKLADVKFDVQKSAVASIYATNDAYFNNRAA